MSTSLTSRALPASPTLFTPAPPVLNQLDVLGRVPVPLRRAFAAGMDHAASAYRTATQRGLRRHLLTGAEWYRPFDGLARVSDPGALPGMLITTLQQDVLLPQLLASYAPRGPRFLIDEPPEQPPSLQSAGVIDPHGVFRVFAIVPFVWLVDDKRLQGRPRPRVWSDLLDACWRDELVFGGFRPNDASPYTEYNGFLLDCIQHEFGAAGLSALARNVRHLQHNVRTATLAGSNSPKASAIAILPFMQAAMCPRRERTQVVWPEDGALVMPIAYLVRPDAERRLQPVIDYLTGPALAQVFGRNGYPAVGPGLVHAPLPAAARFKWPGWTFFRARDYPTKSRLAAETFFNAWHAAHTDPAAGSGRCG
ncbi:MAG: ABC transporter substrate-binding protein [Polyangiales bacterium]